MCWRVDFLAAPDAPLYQSIMTECILAAITASRESRESVTEAGMSFTHTLLAGHGSPVSCNADCSM